MTFHNKELNLCVKLKRGNWDLSSDYLKYRSNGGRLSPEAWNNRVIELKKSR